MHRMKGIDCATVPVGIEGFRVLWAQGKIEFNCIINLARIG